jgi:hypothetical protein
MDSGGLKVEISDKTLTPIGHINRRKTNSLLARAPGEESRSVKLDLSSKNIVPHPIVIQKSGD